MKIYNVEQKTDEWKLLRKGKVTGTDLKRIVGTPTTRESCFYDILAERLAVGADLEESAMDRGNRLEIEAIEAFEKETGKLVEVVGLTESTSNSFIASSPDGLIKNKGKYTEAVEIKCLSDGNHVKGWLKNEIPKEYYPQSIQYFVVNPDLEKLYFVFYNPRITVKSLHIIELDRLNADDDIAEYEHAQNEFLREVDEALEKIIEV